jgi:hypothetical protein
MTMKATIELRELSWSRGKCTYLPPLATCIPGQAGI